MLSTMQAAALEAARPSATVEIAKDLAAMLFEHKKNLTQNAEMSEEKKELVSQ